MMETITIGNWTISTPQFVATQPKLTVVNITTSTIVLNLSWDVVTSNGNIVSDGEQIVLTSEDLLTTDDIKLFDQIVGTVDVHTGADYRNPNINKFTKRVIKTLEPVKNTLALLE